MPQRGTNGVGATIKRLRDERGWTQTQLAEKIGLDTSSVGRKERGIIPISASEFPQFAHAFGLSDAAFDKECQRTDSWGTFQRLLLPIVNQTEHNSILGFHVALPPTATHHVDGGRLGDPRAFAVVLPDDSLAPEFAQGDHVIFSALRQVISGNLVFAQYRNRPAWVVARYRHTEESRVVVLDRINPKYPPLVVNTKDLATIIPAVEHRRYLH